MVKTKEDDPMILTAEEVAEILRTSKWKAYQLMDESDFPLVRIGKLKRVGRDTFFDWIERKYTTGGK